LSKYIDEHKKAHAASTFIMKTDPNIVKEISMFQRFFVCFDELKHGSVGDCRPILCVDASFLKTFLGGTLLTIVGIDRNNQMFPLAWVVAEEENNESRGWFLTNVRACLGGTNIGGLTIISDQHKVLTTLLYANAVNYSCTTLFYTPVVLFFPFFSF